MDERVAALCEQHGWVVVEDLTEQVTGFATPVVRVSAGDRDAVLRVAVESDAAGALRAFSGSGITPEVLDQGRDTTGGEWLLCEWVAGQPLMDPFAVRPTLFDEVKEATGLVLETAHRLHIIECDDPGAHQAAIDEARWLEAAAIEATQLAKSTPHLVRIAEDHWAPAVRTHGDLLATNVILGDDGALRLIDPHGTWGPPERDVGWWLAGVIRTAQLGYVANMDDLWEQTQLIVDDTCANTPWADRKRVHLWTAYALCQSAVANAAAGEPWGSHRASVRIGGLLEQRVAAPPPKAPGRNTPCPCGSRRKYKHCCGS